jgi:histone H3/H4
VADTRKAGRRPRNHLAWSLSGSGADYFTATVQKIVTEILPPATGIAFSKEARDLLIECCVEFIQLLSSEANEISEKEAKKTIACDHITKALEQLGFGEYVPAVLEAAAEHKEVQKVRAAILQVLRRLAIADNSSGTREEGQ